MSEAEGKFSKIDFRDLRFLKYLVTAGVANLNGTNWKHSVWRRKWSYRSKFDGRHEIFRCSAEHLREVEWRFPKSMFFPIRQDRGTDSGSVFESNVPKGSNSVARIMIFTKFRQKHWFLFFRFLSVHDKHGLHAMVLLRARAIEFSICMIDLAVATTSATSLSRGNKVDGSPRVPTAFPNRKNIISKSITEFRSHAPAKAKHFMYPAVSTISRAEMRLTVYRASHVSERRSGRIISHRARDLVNQRATPINSTSRIFRR